MLRRGHMVVTYEPTDTAGEWITIFESDKWGTVKTLLRMGEEADEMTDERQWLKSVYCMRGINCMLGLRTFRNGARCFVVRKVDPSDSDTLIVTLTVDDVTCTHVYRRLADGETP